MPDTFLPTLEQLHLVDRLLDLAMDEDVGEGDATTRVLFPNPGRASGRFTARQGGVMAGGEVIRRFYARLGARFADSSDSVTVDILKKDGERFVAGEGLLGVSGDASTILMGERAALNILQRVCAVAGRTREYADRVAGSRARIYDTRKTTPGSRVLDKLGVRAGGGENHRMGLFDMILIKDNHLAAFGSPAKAVRAARERSSLPIMIEVDDLGQLREALSAEPDYILLDNMSPERLAMAVSVTDEATAANTLRRPQLEASGGITLDVVAAVAAAGVDRISVGALTNGAGSVDIGLDFF